MAYKVKHSVITGAGSGLGLGLAQRLLRRGVTVSVLDLAVTPEARDKLDAAARRGDGRWAFYEMDICDDGAVRAAIGQAVAVSGAPDLAINSAGVVINKTVAAMQAAEFRRVIDINLNGSFHFAAAVLGTMQPGSRLALVASMAGLTSNYAYSAYGSSKFGVVGLATTLRYEYQGLGIGISCICPPEVSTPLVDYERAHGDPIALAIKDIAGSLDADVACDAILEGLDAGRWMIIPGGKAKITAFMARHLPGGFNAFVQKLVARGRQRQMRELVS